MSGDGSSVADVVIAVVVVVAVVVVDTGDFTFGNLDVIFNRQFIQLLVVTDVSVIAVRGFSRICFTVFVQNNTCGRAFVVVVVVVVVVVAVVVNEQWFRFSYSAPYLLDIFQLRCHGTR